VTIFSKDKTILAKQLSSQWISIIFVGISVFIVYSNIYNAPFTFDDNSNIVNNKAIRELSNYFSLEKFLKPRAIVDFTFSINYKYGKLDVFGYHFVNVLIHVLNGIVVYFLVITILKQLSSKSSLAGPPVSDPPDIPIKTIALLSSLLFVVHPIQTQAVTYTVQRYASMAAMFYMASVLFYLKARIFQQKVKSREHGAKSKIRETILNYKLLSAHTLSAFCGMLAFLSKQNTASLPGAILLVEYLLIDRTWQAWKKKAPLFLLIFGLWILFALYITGFFGSGFEGRRLFEDVSGMTKETENISRWQYLCTQFNALVIYIRLLFFPVNQNLDYMYPFKSGFFDSYTPFAFLFLICIASLGIWQIKKRPVISLAILWFFVTLSVESSIIPISDALFEHRLYLPMFGFAILVPYASHSFFSKKKNLILMLNLSVIVTFGISTYLRNFVWQDVETLWSDVISKVPDNFRAYNSLGNIFARKGSSDEAIDHYKHALRIKPDFEGAHNNLGLVLFQKGRVDEAIKHYREALRQKPGYADAHNNIGIAFFHKGQTDKALNHFLEALRIDPEYEKSHNNMGIAFFKEGQTEEAVDHFLEALRIKPDFEEAHNNIGVALKEQGRLDDAIEHYQEAIRIKPDYEMAHNNLGFAFKEQGRLDEAIDHYIEALRIKPDLEEAHNNLGLAFFKKGQTNEAIDHYREALRIKPDYVDAHNNLAVALFHVGDVDTAIRLFKRHYK
jgi:protein O-mannosyl-transferase